MVEPVEIFLSLRWSRCKIWLPCVIRGAKKIWSAGAPLPWDRDRAWPYWNTPLPTRYHTEFVKPEWRTYTGPKTWGTLRPRPLGIGAWLIP